jgi:ADP-ribosylglycohydrolase
MRNQGLRQRAIGAVVGSAAGDALGAPFEFRPSGEYSRRFPQPVVGGIGEMVGGGGFGWQPGEFTDDTQMAVVQVESLLACGGVDGADLFERSGSGRAALPMLGYKPGQCSTRASRGTRPPRRTTGATPTAVPGTTH